ncbi:MAG: methyl-accepting chemotaxis protein [Lachnospiraceae bacterium]|nr:methyl-accepting chemotaxis protein [Lachnospiraceae bacterium]
MKKIEYKFLCVILIISAISVIALCLLGNNLNQMSKVSHELVEVQVDNLTTINEISEQYQNIYRLALCHIMATNDVTMGDYEKSIAESQKTLQNAMTSYGEGIKNEETRAIYDSLKTKVDAYMNSINSIIKYSKEGDKPKSTIFATSTLKPINASLEGRLKQLKEATNNEFAAGESSLRAVTENSSIVIIASFVLLFIACVLVYFVSRRTIVTPINKVSKQLKKIMDGIHNGEGDLTKRVKITSKDEISVLAGGINEFLDILQGIIGNIIESSNQVAEKQTKVLLNVDKANESADDTSSTMEELAAGMEEVSATVTTVSESTKNVEKSAEDMSKQAGEGSDFAQQIKLRASNLKTQANVSKDTASSMIREIDSAVKKSVEESKDIEKITTLTDEILGISNETNLLALNASIEAARAGEAGRGFAVVAEQIRILADNSRKTANNIQEISETVVQSVTLLAENSSKLLGFVNNRVLADYDMLGNTGEQYLEDATTVDEIMGKIAQTANQLEMIMQDVAQANEGISVTVTQSTEGISSVVSNTNELASDMKDISASLNEVQQVVQELRMSDGKLQSGVTAN